MATDTRITCGSTTSVGRRPQLAGTPVVLEATISRDLLALAAQVVPTLGFDLPADVVPPDLSTVYTAATDITHTVDVSAHLAAEAGVDGGARQPDDRRNDGPNARCLPRPSRRPVRRRLRHGVVRRPRLPAGQRPDRRVRDARTRSTMTQPPEPDEHRRRGPRRAARSAHLVEHELAVKSPRRRVIEIIVSLAVVVVLFAFAIPSIVGSGYAEIFEHMKQLTVVELIELTAFWILVMLTYSFVLTNALPGLTHPQALVLNFAGSAVSNVVPFGGAAGVAATYTMTMSWGISGARGDAGILVSGIWNVFTKLGLPVLSLAILVVADRSTAGLVVPTLLGLVMLVGGIVVLHAHPAQRVAGRAHRPVRRTGRLGRDATRSAAAGHGLARRRRRLPPSQHRR